MERAWLRRTGLLLALVLVAVVQYLPHMPGDEADSPADAVTELANRTGAAARGDDYPYPIHVDEHVHMALSAQAARQQDPFFDDPYTGRPHGADPLDVRGNVRERGFWVGLAQVHQLTDVEYGSLFRLLPALWAAGLGALVYFLVRPGPGAVASAAAVAALPTSVLFMGPGFLVPIAFGMSWVVATALVASRARGAAQVLGLMALITGAFFIHLTAGGAAIVTGLVATLARPGRLADRLGLAAASLVPLAWILPAIRDQAVDNLNIVPNHPVARSFFGSMGWPLVLLAIAGVLFVLHRQRAATTGPRIMAGVMSAALVSILVSLAIDHRSLATYYRPAHVLFLGLAVLAGTSAGHLGRWAAEAWEDPHWRRPAFAVAVPVLLMAFALPFAIEDRVDETYYRVHDARTWQAGAGFAASGAGPDDVFLTNPWHAPVYNAWTGATPHTVLRPGSPAELREDWNHYLATNGSTPEWLEARGIDYVIAPVAPNATHETVARDVYRLT